MDKHEVSGKKSPWRGNCLIMLIIALPIIIYADRVIYGPLTMLAERLTATTKVISGYQVAEASQRIRVPDDRPADHLPRFEPAMTELMNSQRGEVYVNRSAAVISLDIVTENEEEHSELAGRLYPTFAAALESGLPILPSLDMIDIYTKQTDDQLVAAIESHIHDGGTVYPGGKQGLLKAILAEVQAAEKVEAGEEAAAFLAAAILLGGDEVELNVELRGLAEKNKRKFLSNPFNAKPIGLYTQTEKLKQIFRRDRLLQQPFDTKRFTGSTGGEGTGAHKYPGRSLTAAIRIAEALDRRPDLLDPYSTYLELGHRLTNPDANLNLCDMLEFKELFSDEAALMSALQGSEAMAKVMESWYLGSGKIGVAVWPFSTSKENQLMSRIYQEMDPEGDIMADLVAAIRSGDLDLTPDARSGWYDYQTYALETLLLPDRAQEAQKLLLKSRYKIRLRRAFESMITQRRETQVKNLAIYSADESAGPFIPEVLPHATLTVEPQPTNYLRTARGYRMLQRRLTELLGADDLATAGIAGTEASVLSMLEEARATFTALYLTCCNDLGMTPVLEKDEVASLDFTLAGSVALHEPPQSMVIDNLPQLSLRESEQYTAACALGEVWTLGLVDSDYMDYDPRVIVPVYSSMDGGYSHYWAVVGVQLAELEVDYATPPRAVRATPQGIVSRNSAAELSLEQANELLGAQTELTSLPWEPHSWFIPVYVFREVRLQPEPPTREEYRAVCDRGKTADEIVGLLEQEFGAV